MLDLNEDLGVLFMPVLSYSSIFETGIPECFSSTCAGMKIT